MNMISDWLALLHLLRPQWLWALIPLVILVVLIARQGDAAARWRGVIAPHLLDYLVVRQQRRWGPRPLHLLALAGVLAIVALAGPAWQREPSPFTEDTAPLVIALELTPEMMVRDVQPSRLDRAHHKILDLLARRGGARTALIAYAGTAHTVLPLTDDTSALAAFVTDLEPAIMPVKGREPGRALAVAADLLDGDGTPGTVLFVASGLPERALPELERFTAERRDQLQVLAVATSAGGALPEEAGGGFSALDRGALERLAERTEAVVTVVTVDDGDVERIVKRTARHLQSVQQEAAEGRWRDEGWWLVLPLVLITALWARRGWLVQWEG